MPKRTMGRPGSIAFDLDGTIVDSAPDIAGALDTLLHERGLEPVGLDGTRRMIGRGIGALVRAALDLRASPASDDALAEAVARFETIYAANLSKLTRPYPGVPETLARLAAEGWDMVVCTNKRERYARTLLEDFDLARLFRLIAGPDTFAVTKPNPDHLLKCFGELRPARSVFVGDSEVDASTARAAGIPFILVTYGYRAAPPDEAISIAPPRKPPARLVRQAWVKTHYGSTACTHPIAINNL